MVRILHVIPHFSRLEAQGRTINELVEHVDGDHLVVCATHDDTATAEVETVGGAPRTLLMRHRTVARSADAFGADVVHVHGGPVGAWTFAQQPFKRPVVFSIYAWPKPSFDLAGSGIRWRSLGRTPVARPQAWLGRLLTPRRVAGAVQAHGLALSGDSEIVEALRGAGAHAEHVTGTVAAGAVERQPRSGGHFVFSGRAEETRGVSVLIEATQQLRRLGVDVTTTLALLPGCDLKRIMQAADGVDGVEVITTRADIAELHRTATAWVLPFLDGEATLTPNAAAAEALAVGVPVIGTKFRTFSEVVTSGDDGFLVDVGDVTALASAMRTLSEQPELVALMGRAAAANTAHRWSVGSLPDVVDGAYSTAISRATNTKGKHVSAQHAP